MLAYGMQLCYFPTPMNSTVDQPPRPAEDSDIVYVQRPSETNPEGEQDNGTSASKTYYCCRYRKFMQGLNWLKNNNPLCQGLMIVSSSEEQFSKEDEKSHEDDEESGIVRSNRLMPNVPVTKLIQDGAFPVHQLERITSAPISIFSEPQLELMAFSTLYPDGRNGFGTQRNAKVSPLEYFQARVTSADPRWAQHTSNLFWACNIVEAYKLQSSSISVALRLRNPATKNACVSGGALNLHVSCHFLL